MHLSVVTRQEIFLYSSKMDLLPGFPSPDGGYPRCAEEWMTVNPYYKSAVSTDEIKSFMKRYGFQTSAIREEEQEQAAREAAMRQEERVQAAREAQREQARKEMEAMEEPSTLQLQLETPDGIGGPTGNAEVMCVDANLTTNQELMSMDIIAEAGAGVAIIDVIKIEENDAKERCETAKEPLVITEYATCSETEPTSPRTINTSLEDDSEAVSSDDENDELLIDFSTSMAIDAATTFTEEDFRAS